MELDDEAWADRCAELMSRAFSFWLGQSGRPAGGDGSVRWIAGPEGLAPMSTVLCTGRTLDLAALERADDALSAHEPLHRVDLRAALEPEAAPWLTARGYEVVDRVPAMVLTGADLGAVRGPEDPRLRRARREEIGRWHDVVMGVMGIDAEATRVLTPDSTVDDPRQAVLLAEVDGEIVGTAQTFRDGDAVGIFNVTVLPEHQRQGLGAALTRAAVSAGLESGARWAYLQSSEAGFPVYRRLGFRTVDEYAVHLPASMLPAS